MSRHKGGVPQLIGLAKHAALHTLATDELELLAAFRQCDARGKRNTFACAMGEVEDNPKLRPRLTLARNRSPIPEAAPAGAKGDVDLRNY